MRISEQGAALLDAIVALSLLGWAAFAIATTVAQSTTSAERAAVVEAETAAAVALLEVIALWPREDLDRHLGTRRVGGWDVTVLRPTAAIYDVAISDTVTGRFVLATSLYRRVADAR
jgi:hypothetical protein